MPAEEQINPVLDAFCQTVQDESKTQADVAERYADLIDTLPADWWGWRKVHDLITERWPQGLRRVKEKAWEIKGDRARAAF